MKECPKCGEPMTFYNVTTKIEHSGVSSTFTLPAGLSINLEALRPSPNKIEKTCDWICESCTRIK